MALGRALAWRRFPSRLLPPPPRVGPSANRVDNATNTARQTTRVRQAGDWPKATVLPRLMANLMQLPEHRLPATARLHLRMLRLPALLQTRPWIRSAAHTRVHLPSASRARPVTETRFNLNGHRICARLHARVFAGPAVRAMTSASTTTTPSSAETPVLIPSAPRARRAILAATHPTWRRRLTARVPASPSVPTAAAALSSVRGGRTTSVAHVTVTARRTSARNATAATMAATNPRSPRLTHASRAARHRASRAGSATRNATSKEQAPRTVPPSRSASVPVIVRTATTATRATLAATRRILLTSTEARQTCRANTPARRCASSVRTATKSVTRTPR